MAEIKITLQTDEKGYFDRECPNENCLYQFKIKMDDWEQKVKDEVHCPLCGHTDTPNKWWTQDQLKQINEIEESYVEWYLQKELDKSFKKLEQTTRHSKFFKVTYKPGRRITFQNNPIGQMKEWMQEITCEECGTSYSVIGSAYFCPCCGYNSASDAFEESMSTIKNMVDSLNEMKSMFAAKYGADKAETMCRSMLENSLGDCVSAFQKFAECTFKKYSSKSVRVNDFQNIDKGNQLFKNECGIEYNQILSNDEMSYLKLFFQRRHIFEHNNGLVDQHYIDNSGDNSFCVGQRMIIRENEILKLICILKKLGEGLLALGLQN